MTEKEDKTAQKEHATDDRCRIKVTMNGPYLVSGGIPISEQTIIADAEGTANEWHEGEKYPLHERYSLCRCGQSKRKPFCDGTHQRVSFDGTEKASRTPCLKRAKVIEGPALRLADVEDLCASARFCHRAGGIWELVQQSNKSAAKMTAIEEARDCPSGRLIVCDKKTGQTIEPECERSIGLVEDPQAGVSGPIWVRGGVPVESVDGGNYEIRNRVTLCRCGKSSNKPFCDSSHYPEEDAHGDVPHE